MSKVTRLAAPAPKFKMAESAAEWAKSIERDTPQQPPDPRIKRLRSLRDGLQRNTVAVTRIIDELINEMESEEDAA
jgi:hypothetical protein